MWNKFSLHLKSKREHQKRIFLSLQQIFGYKGYLKSVDLGSGNLFRYIRVWWIIFIFKVTLKPEQDKPQNATGVGGVGKEGRKENACRITAHALETHSHWSVIAGLPHSCTAGFLWCPRAQQEWRRWGRHSGVAGALCLPDSAAHFGCDVNNLSLLPLCINQQCLSFQKDTIMLWWVGVRFNV